MDPLWNKLLCCGFRLITQFLRYSILIDLMKTSPLACLLPENNLQEKNSRTTNSNSKLTLVHAIHRKVSIIHWFLAGVLQLWKLTLKRVNTTQIVPFTRCRPYAVFSIQTLIVYYVTNNYICWWRLRRADTKAFWLKPIRRKIESASDMRSSEHSFIYKHILFGWVTATIELF